MHVKFNYFSQKNKKVNLENFSSLYRVKKKREMRP